MILRRNLMKKTRKVEFFESSFESSLLEKSSFSSRVSSMSFKNSNLTRNSKKVEFHCMYPPPKGGYGRNFTENITPRLISIKDVILAKESEF